MTRVSRRNARGPLAALLTATFALLALCGGCRPPAEQPPPMPLEEAWEVLYIEGDRVGYGHMVWEPVQEDGRWLLRIANDSEMTVQRFGQSVTQQISLVSWETLDGRLLRCSTRLTQGPVTSETTGQVAPDQLTLSTRTLGKTETASIPWDSSWGGYFADQASLRRQPMQPGQRRTLQALIPLFNQQGEIEMEAVERERVELLSGARELLRINSSIRIAGTTIDTVIWADDSGEPLKVASSFSGFQQESYRTTPEVALAGGVAQQFDLGQRTLVRVQRQLEAPHQTRRAVYLARITGGDAAAAFVDGLSQSVEPVEDGWARIVVRAVRPDDPPDAVGSIAPTEAELWSNSLIQSEDPQIVALADQIEPDQQDPWALACALERHVRDAVQTKDFTQAMASAADVVRSLEGDCTEHAVLLAALCRARGIPARVAMGLVYSAPANGFAYHMWNEVWIHDRWVPLDATLGLGGIGAAHLKVSQSNLDGASPYGALLPVLDVVGRLELKIAEVD